jgi:hypothetical protein
MQLLLNAIVLASLAVGMPAPSLATEQDGANKSRRDNWTEYYAKQLPSYEFHLATAPDAPLKVDPKALLRWANPVRIGNTHGDVFVWTHQGRAALIGSIFSYDDLQGGASPTERIVAHMFHSLTEETIVGTWKGQSLLTIRGPGVTYEIVDGAPLPARTRPLRLTQMRMLAKQFEASLRENNVVQPLRPLPQPLYRYRTKEADEDGAVFAYVLGTDPELIMVLESRQTDDGLQWHFAAGRYANTALQLKLRDRTVWEFDGRASRESGYFSQHEIDRQPLTPGLDRLPD